MRRRTWNVNEACRLYVNEGLSYAQIAKRMKLTNRQVELAGRDGGWAALRQAAQDAVTVTAADVINTGTPPPGYRESPAGQVAQRRAASMADRRAEADEWRDRLSTSLDGLYLAAMRALDAMMFPAKDADGKELPMPEVNTVQLERIARTLERCFKLDQVLNAEARAQAAAQAAAMFETEGPGTIQEAERLYGLAAKFAKERGLSVRPLPGLVVPVDEGQA